MCSNRTLALVRGVFQYAVDREELDANPALRIPRRHLYAEKPRERVIAEEEVRVLWSLFDRLQPTVAAAWRLILLTAQRPGEVLSMRWRDLERDSRGSWWNIPAELTKTNRAHRVPLSPQAVAVIEALRPLTGSTEWSVPRPENPVAACRETMNLSAPSDTTPELAAHAPSSATAAARPMSGQTK